MKMQKSMVIARVLLMLCALVGIIYAMSYLNSGKAFKDPNSAAQILIGTPPAQSASH
jgi:hypothetical protein